MARSDDKLGRVSRTRCWILSERVLGVDLVERALGVYVEQGKIQAVVPLHEARELSMAGLTADGIVPSWRPTEPPRPPSSNPRPADDDARTTTDVRRRTSETRFAPLPVHDFGARPVVPAFVNGHTHLGMAPLRGITSRAARAGDVVKDVFFRIEEHLTPADVLAFTRVAAFECLLAGVAEVWDHYYYGESIAQALLEVGLTGTVAPTLQDVSGPGCQRADDELEATHLIASNSRLRAFGIDAALGIHASDTASDELLRRAGDLARSLGLPVHLHLLQSPAEFHHRQSPHEATGIRAVLEHLDGTRLVVAHALFASRSDVAALCKSGATLAFCPLSQAQFGFLGPIEDWLESGGGFALGTDSVASNDTLDVQRELALTANLAGFRAAHGSERDRFFETGDQEAARALEARRQHLVAHSRLLDPSAVLLAAWGMHLPGGPRGIQPGAPANLLVLDPDHPALFPADDLSRLLVHAAIAPAIHQLLVHGQPVAEAGHLQRGLLGKDEYKSALGEALARRSELYARAGI